MKRKSSKRSTDLRMDDLFKIASIFNEEIVPIVKNTKEQIIESAHDYLSKGERILTLAKREFMNAVNKLSFQSSFEQMLYEVKPSVKEDLIDAITNKVVRPILRATTIDDSFSLSSPKIAEMLSYIEFDVALHPIDNCDYKCRFYRYLDEGDTMLHLCIKESLYEELHVYGLKNHAHNQSWRNKLYRNGDAVADIARVLTWLIILSVFIKATRSSSSDSFKDTKKACEKNCLLDKKETSLKFFSFTNFEYFSSFQKETLVDIWSHKWIVPNECKENYIIIKPYLDAKNVHVVISTDSQEELENYIYNAFKAGAYNDILDIPLVVGEHTTKLLWNRNPLECMEYIPHTFRYHFLLPNSKSVPSHYWALPAPIISNLGRIVYEAFSADYNNNHTKTIALNELKRLNSEYAKSFQTKKNIPQKTLDAMQASFFNDYFGYVEFDEKVDLDKVRTIEEEFVAFKETYLPNIDSTDNSIRFRRLGNHRAAGLYYPGYKALCVDIHSPSSLIHEYGHLIDYCYGNLSFNSDFYQIKRLYEEHIHTCMVNDTEFSSRMKSKSKYNLSYFLNPTEIWARCFEIYFKIVLGIDNSLTPILDKDVYPTDEKMLALIDAYYSSKLSSLRKFETDTAVIEKAAEKT